MRVTSSNFETNVMIPKQHTGFGADLSPELIVEEIPREAVSLAIIMDDLDIPFVREFPHWLIWNIPPLTVIPQGIPKGTVINKPFQAVQGNAWGKHVYRGPKQPPFIHKVHRYRFSVFALDKMLDITSSANRGKLVQAMAGHVIEKAEFVGIYDPLKNGDLWESRDYI